MDTDKVMRGLEALLRDQDLLGKLDSWATKKQNEKDAKKKASSKASAKAKSKLKKTKLSYGINKNAIIDATKISVTTKDLNNKK